MVIFIGFGRKKTPGSSSFTNTRNIFTFVHKRNKTTINRNEIKHNERDKSLQNENKFVFTRLTADQSNKKYGLKFDLDWRLKHSWMLFH